MIKHTNILEQYLYFSKFVSREVREAQIIKKDLSLHPDYSDFIKKVKAIPETYHCPEIRNMIFSVNAGFVSTAVKNTDGYLLFVEYGAIDIEKQGSNDNSEMVLAISIAHEMPSSSGDMIEELLLSQTCFDLLKKILDKMYEDYENLENCQENELVIYPAELYPIMPAEFFGRGGWTAMFKSGRILP